MAEFREVPHVEIRRSRPVPVLDDDVTKPDGHVAVAKMLYEILGGLEQESFVVLMVNGQGRVTAWREVARGMAHKVEVPVRDLFRISVLLDATAIIISHNHPSGDPTPSVQDEVLTARLREAGMLIDLPVIDHIIIGDNDRYYSFRHGHFPAKKVIHDHDALSLPLGETQPPELD